ncbi:hypothetical protein DES53_11367 [Roseimicrobium gellanilyticum]|uniref:ABC-2 type transport system permease protein n=1 Tax=Roseimicrobium gellanilyticum TaxID=748857 RepID=A0A366H9C2_9BACT|nr:hypothetical protein [Roseimicrobium gellanilyticum]RBP37685.1 hypothetical protein DES53_11367 [Roseimicrobium gellanilyticum]
MSSATVAPRAPERILPNGMDFADWLSPILVKELRQGLKTKMFITTFILIQVVMILITGLQLLEVAHGGSGSADGFSGFFAAFIWIPLLILMPARGLTAVSEELKVNTLDLVQLTHLTAFRIVLGKWVALIAQTLLVVTAILPYAVLRYFFGEVDIVSDLTGIGIMMLASMVLTAGALALSSAHIALRILVVLGLFFAMSFLLSMVFDRSYLVSGGGPSRTWLLWMLPLLAVMHVYLLLEIAASRIAPISENHSGRKRMVILVMGAVGVLLAWFGEEHASMTWTLCCSVATAWVMLESLSERTQHVPSLYSSFARRGFFGRLAGRLLYPGWASGLVFTLVLAGLAFAIGMGVIQRFKPVELGDYLLESRLMFPIIFTSIISPVVVILLFPRARQPIWLYVLSQALFGLCYVVANVAGNAPSLDPEDAFRWLAPLPTSVWFVLMEEGAASPLGHFYAMFTLPACAIICAYLGFRAMREFRFISELEKQSQASTKEFDYPTPVVSNAA